MSEGPEAGLANNFKDKPWCRDKILMGILLLEKSLFLL
jgi:hypothetical protein